MTRQIFFLTIVLFVRLTIYRALVLYDAVAAAAALVAAGQNPILRIGGQELALLCHNGLQ
jgi:hypothetical protein